MDGPGQPLDRWRSHLLPVQQKTLSGMTGLFYNFHVSQAAVHPTGVNKQGFWLSSPKVNGTAVLEYSK